MESREGMFLSRIVMKYTRHYSWGSVNVRVPLNVPAAVDDESRASQRRQQVVSHVLKQLRVVLIKTEASGKVTP
jgi:hypothetical protein